MAMMKSFSTRLSIYILAVTTILFTLSFTIYFRYSSNLLLREAIAKQEAEVEQITYHISSILSEVELSVESTLFGVYNIIENRGDFSKLQIGFMSHNDAIHGAAVAFEPYIFDKSERYYMQYTMHKRDAEFSTQIIRDGDNYDYCSMDWYMTPKLSGQSYWSEPYLDQGAGGVAMTTYSVPLYDEDSQFIGVATADIALEWITQVIAEYRPYPNSYAYMLSKKGYYLAHKNVSSVLNETFFSTTDGMHNETLTEIGHEMLALKRGNKNFVFNGSTRYAFYAPVERAGWSVGTVSFKDDIFMEINEINRNFWVIIVCGLLLIFLFVVYVIYLATRPLVHFANFADEISRGDLDVPAPNITTRDEMYRLREAFVNMQGSLKCYISEIQDITAARERIESELTIAKEIQMGMLPTIFPPYPNMPNLDLFSTLVPAKEVGGDLYDFFGDGDTLYFTVGDASGKGVPASLLMAVTSSLFRSMAKYLKDPAKILESMNNSISEKNEACMFITLFVGALNVKTGELHYSSAGHNAPVLIRDGEATLLELAPNIPLGVASNMEFSSHKIMIKSSDMLFLYTDGLTEAENEAQELYSEERLMSLLLNLEQSATPRDVVDRISTSVQTFVQGNAQSDDLTMLAVKLLNR